MMKYFVCLFLLFSSSISAQVTLKGFYQPPSYIEKSAVENTMVGYGMDFIEYGKIPSYHKIVIWDSIGEVREEIDLTSLFSYTHNQNTYKGQFVSCQLSPDKKSIVVIGRDYQFQGDFFETIIYSYSLEKKEWLPLFISKEYQCLKVAFHPTSSELMVGYATTKATRDSEYEVFLFDIKKSQMIKKIKTYKYPGIPISINFSKDGKRLFVFEGRNSDVGFMDIFSTTNYATLKRISIKDHINKVFETTTDLYFCGAYKTFVYSIKDLKIKQTLNFDDVKGVYPESNFMLLTEHGKTGRPAKSAFYNLKTKKLSYWSSGTQVLQNYDPETNAFIAFDGTEFFQYDENYKRIFSPPTIEDLLPPVILRKIDIETILKQ